MKPFEFDPNSGKVIKHRGIYNEEDLRAAWRPVLRWLEEETTAEWSLTVTWDVSYHAEARAKVDGGLLKCWRHNGKWRFDIDYPSGERVWTRSKSLRICVHQLRRQLRIRSRTGRAPQTSRRPGSRPIAYFRDDR